MTNTPGQSATRFSRFDRVIIGAIVLLLLLITITSLVGDSDSITVISAAPTEAAASTNPITLQFSEPMDPASVLQRLQFDPPVAGSTTWEGTTLIFRPDENLTPGVTYEVTLAAGAAGLSGHKLPRDYRFSFAVRMPRLAYLAPVNSTPQNIWIIDLASPGEPVQVTSSETGIYNFDVSPDGSKIAFAETGSSGSSADIKIIDLETGELLPVTDCADNECHTPSWSPDGTQIAYQRRDNGQDSTVHTGHTRIWLADLTGDPPTNRPLFSDADIGGTSPVWSPDGTIIASYDVHSNGILLYNLVEDTSQVIPTQHGSTGAFSPDGQRLAYPDITLQETGAYGNLYVADLTTRRLTALSTPGELVDDGRVIWTADGENLIVARRYLDERFTQGQQIYLMSPLTGDVKPLVVDAGYSNGYFALDPSGQLLGIQRLQQAGNGSANGDIRPELWLYDFSSRQLRKLTTGAFLPRWVP